MEIALENCFPAEELAIDTETVRKKLEASPRIAVIDRNRPQFVILTLDAYRSLTAASGSRQEDGCSAGGGQKIGKYVQETMRRLLQEGRLPSEELQRLTTPDYASATFHLHYPVLKRYEETVPFPVQKCDKNGYNRYYNFLLSAGTDRYLLCSQWVEPLHRRYYEAWLRRWLPER